MAEYGNECISTYLPVNPWASRTMSRLEVKTAASRKVWNAAQGLPMRPGARPQPQRAAATG